MKKKWIALFLAGVLICGMAGCGSGTDKEPEIIASVVKEESVARQEESKKDQKEEQTADSKTEEQKGEPTGGPTEEQKGEPTEEFGYEGDATSYYVDLYAPIIGNYYFAMKEEWSAEELLQDEMSLLCLDYYENRSLC